MVLMSVYMQLNIGHQLKLLRWETVELQNCWAQMQESLLNYERCVCVCDVPSI